MFQSKFKLCVWEVKVKWAEDLVGKWINKAILPGPGYLLSRSNSLQSDLLQQQPASASLAEDRGAKAPPQPYSSHELSVEDNLNH